MLLSPANTCNPHAAPIHSAEHQMKQYLDMKNQSVGLEQQPEEPNHNYWSVSPSVFKTGRKRTQCYDLRRQSTTHPPIERSEPGLDLSSDSRTRGNGYRYGPIPSSAPSDIHGPVEGSSLTSYSESESERGRGFSLSLSPKYQDDDQDSPIVLAPQACDPPGLYPYMGVGGGGGRFEGVPVLGFDKHTASETSACSYDGSLSIDDEIKPVFQNTSVSWPAGDLSDGPPVLQDSPATGSVGTATDSFESSCGAVTPLSWSAFGAHPGLDMGQEEPACGDAHAHALWPAQRFQDEPSPFIPVTTSPFDAVPRVREDGLPLLEEGYHAQPERYHHHQEPIHISIPTPAPAINNTYHAESFDIPRTKDQTMLNQSQSQIQYHLSTNISPIIPYHINPTSTPITYAYTTDHHHNHPKLTPTAPTDNINININTSSSSSKPTILPCPIDTRNALLIEYKRRGLSYKDIKRLGNFREAESTLRGRFRTLTKTKDQRVRKPRWLEKDIHLLQEAVAVYAEAQAQPHYCHPHRNASRQQRQKQRQIIPKVSWKKVAQYIWGHGGSYHFGNATCKKKWCEVYGVDI